MRSEEESRLLLCLVNSPLAAAFQELVHEVPDFSKNVQVCRPMGALLNKQAG